MTQNITRRSHYNQKTNLSVFTAEHISYTDLTADSNSGSIFFVMPDHSIVFHVLLIEESPADASAKFNITVGGISLVTNGALDANGIIHSNLLDNIHFEEGGDVVISKGTGGLTQGIFTFVIVYNEHTLHSGQYTNFSDN